MTIFVTPAMTNSYAAPPDTVMDVPLAEFQCIECSVRRFTDELVRGAGITAHCAESSQATITIDAKNVTPRELLDQAVFQAPDYMWTPAGLDAVALVPVAELADPQSRWNTRVTYVTHGPMSVGQIVRDMMQLSHASAHPITGSVGGGFGGWRDTQPEIDVEFSDTPFLQVLNGVFAAAGRRWCTKGKFITTGGGARPEVTTALHRDARRAVENGLDDHTTRTLFLAAIGSVPVDFQPPIRHDYAAYLTAKGDFAAIVNMQPEMLESIYRNQHSNGTNITTLELLTMALAAAGKASEAERLLVGLYKDEDFAQKNVISRDQVGNALLNIYSTGDSPRDLIASLRDEWNSLEAKRALLPEYPEFQMAIDERQLRMEEQMAVADKERIPEAPARD